VKHLLPIVWCVVVLTACAFPAAPTPAAVPAGPTGVADDVIPTSVEIEKAKQVLGEKGFLGLVACNLSSEYHAAVPKGAQRMAEQYGIRLEVFDSQSTADRQVSAISDFEVKGAKAIAVCAIDPKVVQKAIQESAANGVIMLQYAGRDLPVGIGISIDDGELGCQAGQIAGQLIAQKKNGQATVAILDYPALPNVVLRADQIEACLKQAAPQARVVGRYLGGTAENGLKSLENALQAHPDIDMVVSINDAGAYGAVRALEAAGKDPATTFVVGIDGEKQAKDLIKQGRFFRGTVDTAPQKTGEMVVQAAIKLLAGASVPQAVPVPIIPVTEESLK
jgi:ribose transport system substrate-binding protein